MSTNTRGLFFARSSAVFARARQATRSGRHSFQNGGTIPATIVL